VQLVDEQDMFRFLRDFVDDRLEPLLELAAVFVPAITAAMSSDSTRCPSARPGLAARDQLGKPARSPRREESRD